MIKYLSEHRLLSLTRKMNPKTLPIQLLLVIFGLLMLAYMVYNGFLTTSFIDSNGLFRLDTTMLRFFILFSLVDLISRFYFQKLSAFNLEPYILLQISKIKLSLYNEFFSLFQLYNLTLFFFFFSTFLGFFLLGNINREILIFYLFIFLISLLDHAIIRSSKLLSSIKKSVSLFFLIIALLYFLLKYPFYIELVNMPRNDLIIISVLILLLFFFGLTIINIKSYAELFYLDKQTAAINFKIPQYRNFALKNPLLALELKMISRNKRPRETFFISLFTFLSMLILSILEGPPLLKYFSLYIAMFSGSMGYLQFAFSWENQYWNFINTNNISIYNYTKTKYIILFSSTTLSLLIILASFLYFKLLSLSTLIQISSIWFIIQGFVYPVYLLIISRMIRQINIKSGIMMNNEGKNPLSLAIDLGISFLPLIAFMAINYFLSIEKTVIIIAFLGIFGLLKLKKIFRYTEKSFHELKHQILDKYQ
ncbi:MAG: hypothetical protein KAI81_00335 [Candidatus Marinimicrobia bacterium]|nr:hypothetical protein [Candidatus Neomarinimicrobiota bacterium]